MVVGWIARILRISVKGTGTFQLTFYFLTKKISHLLSVPRTEIAVYTKVNSRLFHYYIKLLRIRMFIPDPGSSFLSILDLGSNINKRGGKGGVCWLAFFL
jgi:hypothetical protein